MVIVKDNHIAAMGRLQALQAAIAQFRSQHPRVRVEIEADTVKQVREFLTLDGLDIILLDNMTCDEMAEAGETRRRADAVRSERRGSRSRASPRSPRRASISFPWVRSPTPRARSITRWIWRDERARHRGHPRAARGDRPSARGGNRLTAPLLA